GSNSALSVVAQGNSARMAAITLGSCARLVRSWIPRSSRRLPPERGDQAPAHTVELRVAGGLRSVALLGCMEQDSSRERGTDRATTRSVHTHLAHLRSSELALVLGSVHLGRQGVAAPEKVH